MVQTYLLDGVAGACILVFAALLSAWLGRAQGAIRPLARVVLASGGAAASVSFVQPAIGEVLAKPVPVGASAVEVRGVLFKLLNTADAFKMIALGMMVAAASLMALRARILPRWIAWLGIVEAVLLPIAFVLRSTGLHILLYQTLPFLLIWVGAVSVVIWRRTERSARVSPGGVAEAASR